MPYEVNWYKEKRIVYENMIGDITLEEVQNSTQKVQDLIDEGEAPVHLIVDIRTMTRVMNSIRDIANTAKILRNQKLGWVILVSDGKPLLDFMASVVSQITRMQLAKRESLDEVNDFLVKQDPTLGVIGNTPSS